MISFKKMGLFVVMGLAVSPAFAAHDLTIASSAKSAGHSQSLLVWYDDLLTWYEDFSSSHSS